MSKKSARHLTVALFVVAFCIVQLAMAQVTFSKGWGPGKRAALYDAEGPGKRTALYETECRVNAKSLALIFHTLMAEIKHLTACDHQAMVNYLQTV